LTGPGHSGPDLRISAESLVDLLGFLTKSRLVFTYSAPTGDHRAMRSLRPQNLRRSRKFIAGAAAALGAADEDAALDERQNVAQGCVVGTLGECGTLGGGELAFEAIEQVC
jgi:hypothetical protein